MILRWSVAATFACAGCSATVSNDQAGGVSHPVDGCAATALTCRIDGARVVCNAPSAAVTVRMFVKRAEKNELVVLDRDGCAFIAATPTNAMVIAISAYRNDKLVLGITELTPPPSAP
jgi:hypothetical protein